MTCVQPFISCPIVNRSKVRIYRSTVGKLYGAHTYQRTGKSGCYAEISEVDDTGSSLCRNIFTIKERNQEGADAAIQREVQQRRLSFVSEW